VEETHTNAVTTAFVAKSRGRPWASDTLLEGGAMKLLVCGDRNYRDYDRMADALDQRW
jgi:hypothetical protein